MKNKAFEKHRLSFTSQQGKMIFGEHFKSGKQAAIQAAAKLLLSDQLNQDGTINENNISYLSDHDVWSYIYYLYSFNNEHINEFIKMKDEEGQASAELFYDVVRSRVDNSGLKTYYNIRKLNVPELIKFVKIVVQRYKKDLVNPVIDHYNIMLQANLNSAFKNINVVVRTGDENARIVTNPKNVAKSDIVIKIGMRNSSTKS